MCGIVGYLGEKPAQSILIEGLTQLEYRGYDSSGIAIFNPDTHSIQIKRAPGKLKELKDLLEKESLKGSMGIGHTRWATHGKPNEENAHPHIYQGIAIVHNGIIENHLELKTMLLAKGHVFSSETDSEVIAHLIAYHRKNHSFENAFYESLKQLTGAFAIAALDESTQAICVAQGACPLNIGVAGNTRFIASDISAFLNHTKDFYILEEGEWAYLSASEIKLFNMNHHAIQKNLQHIHWDIQTAQKNGHPHFMHKEIHEHPHAITDTLRERLLVDSHEIQLGVDLPSHVNRIVMSACGSAYYAGLLGKYLIEEISRIPVEVELASELRYKKPLLDSNTLFIAISQSGETADTIGAIQVAKALTPLVMSVCNVMGSTITRLCEPYLGTLYTRCGPEKSVASTKAFLSQAICLYLIALKLGKNQEQITAHIGSLTHLPHLLALCLKEEEHIKQVANRYKNAQAMLLLGRGLFYTMALEGSLKIKELAYVHSLGCAAGEMKHGPIALIDAKTPVVVLASRNETYAKTLSNAQETKARGASLIGICPPNCTELIDLCDEVILLPEIQAKEDFHLSALCATIPLHLFAYYLSLLKGHDVDQPRNLAKSVTVE